VADQSNIQASYWVGVVCFLYLAFYAIAVKGILQKQGIAFDQVKAGGH
jgi:FHS family L-fucose permease-like MFS transporter